MWGWVVSTTPRPLYPRERPGTHYTGGWVGPRARLDGCGKSRPPPTGNRSPDRPAHSESLYRLSYRGRNVTLGGIVMGEHLRLFDGDWGFIWLAVSVHAATALLATSFPVEFLENWGSGEGRSFCPVFSYPCKIRHHTVLFDTDFFFPYEIKSIARLCHYVRTYFCIITFVTVVIPCNLTGSNFHFRCFNFWAACNILIFNVSEVIRDIYIHSNEIHTVAALIVYWCSGVSSTCFGP